MNKIAKRNKKKLSQMIKLSRKGGFDDLCDYKHILCSMANVKQRSRVEKKAEEILDFDNVTPFLKSRFLVPILYKLPNGKIKSFGGKRMFSSMEDVEEAKLKFYKRSKN